MTRGPSRPLPDEGAAAARVRPAALALPGVVEEQAWTGVRWRVRGRTFAHVLVVEDGRPQGYAAALPCDDPCCVVVLRSSGAELDALAHAGPPFAVVPSREGVVLVDLAGPVDDDELRELVTESWLLLAPPALAARVLADGPA